MAGKKKKTRQYNTEAIRRSDIELAQRIEERTKARDIVKRRKKIIMVLVIIAVFALLATMCGREIVRLKAENIALRKQQAELEKQRDELKEELASTDDPEYIREQARKQLRLLNPGEILFTFDDDGSADADSGGGDE